MPGTCHVHRPSGAREPIVSSKKAGPVLSPYGVFQSFGMSLAMCSSEGISVVSPSSGGVLMREKPVELFVVTAL